MRGKHESGPVPVELLGCDQYQEFNSELGCIRSSPGDNCGKVCGRVAIVKNIVVYEDSEYVLYSRFKTCGHFFTYPMPSEEIGILRVCDLHSVIEVAPTSTITGKMVLLPVSVSDSNRQTHVYMVSPLLHTFTL